MSSLGQAIDAYIGHLARAGRAPSTLLTYRRLLDDFAESCHDKEPSDLTLADYERFLNRWVSSAPSTLASGVSLVRGFSHFLEERGFAESDIAQRLSRPRRLRSEDLAVVTVSGEDVRLMLAACIDWQEFLCLTSAAYLGARRAALARIRRGDVDLVDGTARFLEKGGKVALKPLPDEYRAILRAAERDGLWRSPEDYLIPNRRSASVKREERSDKVVWETVKRVARRAGVRAHVHALRAAFAVAFDEAHPDETLALKDLLGHTRLETTLVYLRRRNKARAMESVRDLSWGVGASGFAASPASTERGPVSDPGLHARPSMFPESIEEAHTGFEPVPSEFRLSEPLRRKLDELRREALRVRR